VIDDWIADLPTCRPADLPTCRPADLPTCRQGVIPSDARDLKIKVFGHSSEERFQICDW
jgi:hypothetical protein